MKSKEGTIPSYLKDDCKDPVEPMDSQTDCMQAHPKFHLYPEIGLGLSRSVPLLAGMACGLSLGYELGSAHHPRYWALTSSLRQKPCITQLCQEQG